MDGVVVKGGLFFLDDRVMAIDSHQPVIVQKGKKLFLAFHSFVESNNTIYGNSCLEERNV